MDREMLRAVRPCLATTDGKLLILSSPYGQSGALWDLHRQHFGRDDSSILVWQASAPEMNRSLPSDYLERMAQDDPGAYRSEVLGEFRAGISSLFDPDALGACVIAGRREMPRPPGTVYRAFVDPSGGRSDSFALAIGHRDSDRFIVDVMRPWSPPFNPAGEWSREAFRAHGIAYAVAEPAKSELYLELVAAVNAGRIELPDIPDLLRELRGLERRRGPSGRDRVDHRPGGHDDQANAVAGLASLLKNDTGRPRAVPPPPPQTTDEIIAAQLWSGLKPKQQSWNPYLRRYGFLKGPWR